MTRAIISEPNFTSTFTPARPGQSASLEIALTVHLAPMDPRKPYNPGTSDAPWPFSEFLSPEARQMIWPTKANLNFQTHLANTPQQMQKGFVFDGDNPPTRFAARSWMQHEFEVFKAKFKRMVELSWNNQIVLLPPDDPADGLGDAEYMEFVSNPNIAAHAVGSLRIILVPSQAGANVAMQVVRLDREESAYAGKRFVMPLPGEGEFRSWAWTITNEDVYRKTTTSYRWPNVGMSQIAAAHEIGHWLGRPVALGDMDRYVEHIDAKKYAKTHPDYDELQYGGSASRRLSLSGVGSLVTEYDARPWLNRIRRHTNALFGWRLVHRVNFAGIVPLSARQKRLTGKPGP